ncbi:acyltransferase [Sphingomonas koreensis]|nr:acyltransferase [Sphingomonas koreensis]
MGFKSIGENVSISTDCIIIGLGNISIGDHTRIDSGTAIFANGADITIGCNVHISGGCHLAGRGGITMEDFSGLSQGVRIFSASDDYSGAYMTNPTVPEEFTNATIEPVVLGRHVIVGAGSVILPGCSIGEGSAVGALALVAKPLAQWGIYAGNPARLVRERSRDLLAHEKDFTARTV